MPWVEETFLPPIQRFEKGQVSDEFVQTGQRLHSAHGEQEEEHESDGQRSDDKPSGIEQQIVDGKVVPIHVARLRSPLRQPLGVVAALLRLSAHGSTPTGVEGNEARAHHEILLGKNALALRTDLKECNQLMSSWRNKRSQVHACSLASFRYCAEMRQSRGEK